MADEEQLHDDEGAADDPARLMTLAEAAERLHMSVRSVRRLIDHGYLEGYRVGRRAVRVKLGDVHAALERLPDGYATGDD